MSGGIRASSLQESGTCTLDSSRRFARRLSFSTAERQNLCQYFDPLLIALARRFAVVAGADRSRTELLRPDSGPSSARGCGWRLLVDCDRHSHETRSTSCGYEGLQGRRPHLEVPKYRKLYTVYLDLCSVEPLDLV